VSENFIWSFIKLYSTEEGFEGLCEKYVEWIDIQTKNILNPAGNEAKNKKQSEARKELAFHVFLEKSYPALLPAFNKLLKEHSVRQMRLLGKAKPDKELALHCHNGMFAYIPGSSVKGMMRTALLFRYVKRHASELNMLNFIGENVDIESIEESLIEKVFYCKSKQKNSDSWEGKDAKFDLLKFLVVSDFLPVSSAAWTSAVGKVNLYVLKDESLKEQKQTPWVEALSPHADFLGDVFIDIEALLQIRKKWNEKEDAVLLPEGEVFWKGIAQKMKLLFDVDFSELNQNNKHDFARSIEQAVLEATDSFARAQLKDWNEWLDRIYAQVLEESEALSKIAEGFDNLSASVPEDKTLLHVGYASGFKGTTILLAIANLRDLKIKLREHLGVHSMSRFPVSRRAILLEEETMPMGWGTIERCAKGKAEELMTQWRAHHEEKRRKSVREIQKEKVELKEPTPTLYTGKIKPGAVVPAVVEVSGNPNKVRLLIKYEKIQQRTG
jgi:CRISPR/Cas system CSM-associated protein Csm5 (group 7 of RAMP superfamily)